LFVDVRVGDSQFDSSILGSHTHGIDQFLPLDDDLEGIKRALWYETDLRYKQAIMNFLKKKGRLISGSDPHLRADFSIGSTRIHEIKPIPEFIVDIENWEEMARKISKLFKSAPKIERTQVKINADRIVRYYLDSENNKIRDSVMQYRVTLEAWTKADSGGPLHDIETRIFSDPKKLPSEAELTLLANNIIGGINRLQKAPQAEPYVGPAIFSPDATAVLFHEALGHRLEGDRLRTRDDGKTFVKQIGKLILPDFLSVEDNPRLKQFKEKDLAGHYLFDDQGQRSEKVLLVDRGVLKTFLLSRSPVKGSQKTNGHARSDGVRFPMSRMGNFIVSSDKKLSSDELKQQLILEVKRQNKPFGLYIRKILSGETKTQSTDIQVFKGKPLYLYKVYPEDGREELVRGVEFVGTPLSMISKILATGNDSIATNGICGAESGFVPVASIAPSVLLSEVELQTTSYQKMRQPVLPPPDIPSLQSRTPHNKYSQNIRY
jgi:predicted Zn-dependent protease